MVRYQKLSEFFFDRKWKFWPFYCGSLEITYNSKGGTVAPTSLKKLHLPPISYSLTLRPAAARTRSNSHESNSRKKYASPPTQHVHPQQRLPPFFWWICLKVCTYLLKKIVHILYTHIFYQIVAKISFKCPHSQ